MKIHHQEKNKEKNRMVSMIHKKKKEKNYIACKELRFGNS